MTTEQKIQYIADHYGYEPQSRQLIEEMAELMESISTFGVINPVIVRRTGDERYEMISGHRRKYACLKLGIDTLPVIVRDLSREEAIIYMNIHLICMLLILHEFHCM